MTDDYDYKDMIQWNIPSMIQATYLERCFTRTRKTHDVEDGHDKLGCAKFSVNSSNLK